MFVARFVRENVLLTSGVSQRLWSSSTPTTQDIQDNTKGDLGLAKDESSGIKPAPSKKTEFGIRKMLEQNFKHFFSCSEGEAIKLVTQNKILWKIPLQKINANIEFLFNKNIKAKSIIENPWLLGAPISKFCPSFIALD